MVAGALLCPAGEAAKHDDATLIQNPNKSREIDTQALFKRYFAD